MYITDIKTYDNESLILITNDLSNRIKFIQINNEYIDFCIDQKENTIKINHLPCLANNSYFTMEFFDDQLNKLEIHQKEKGNYPFSFNNKCGFITEREEKILIKFVDYAEDIFNLETLQEIKSVVSLKDNGNFIDIKLNDYTNEELNNIFVILEFDENDIYCIPPILFGEGKIILSKSFLNNTLSSIHLLVRKNKTVFKITQINNENLYSKEVIDESNTFGVWFNEEEILKSNISKMEQLAENSLIINIDNVTVNGQLFTLNLKETCWSANKTPWLLIRKRKGTESCLIKGLLMEHSMMFDMGFLVNILANKKEKWDLYLLGEKNDSIFSLKFVREPQSDNNNNFLHFFKHCFPTESTYNLNTAILLDEEGFLFIEKDKISNIIKRNYKIKTSISRFSMHKEVAKFKVTLTSPQTKLLDLHNIYLVYRNKDSFDSVRAEIINIRYENEFCEILCRLDLSRANLFPLYWDIFIGISFPGNTEKLIKATNVSEKVYQRVDNTITKYQLEPKKGYVIYPYITVNNDLAFVFREKEYFENKYYLFKENVAYFIYRLFQSHFSKKEIWIGYEKLAMSAHESGYYFFDYVYKNHKHKEFYYVIRKESPEAKNLSDKVDKVLYFMSFKYFIYMFASDLLISSDTKRNSYNLKQKKSILGKELGNKQLVYLQHGVNGLKVVKDFYKKRGVFDLVIAPSEFEKNIIIKEWGYKENEVVTTGLARWDVLVDKTDQINYKQIFVMPTWRTWMEGMSKEDFLNSNYYKYYNEFLSSSKLDKLLKINNVKIKFFLHPKFKEYIDLFNFESSNIEKFGFLEVPLDEMIMKSSLMISDYSSVIWEMFYLKKPCVFYHFDKDKYLQYEGTYMDLDKDLFGDVALNADQLVNIVESYVLTNFKEKPEYGILREKYFTYMDHNNSERIYTAIEENKKALYKKRKLSKWKFSHILPFRVRKKILDLKNKLTY
ncbi:hypothetical protein BME96_16450 [Virgibacillus halodenitrificans]|uniref:Teichoic acid biosynthesis protein n=1 Tax=Virgibacillus halodenitrificans TaxID=1482 RepID=A0AAC9J1H0_VIRHA|nr:CDP-glycerol glycerophosphotransferase family protein [Virgibacillus halodenitrificans]APC49681.1 hypothetical protein BME96_16450 [Virgibacillus halodenitrificans]